MTVNTKQAIGRRDVHYDSLDEMLADAEGLASSGGETVGNWSLGQIFKHLAQAIHSSIDGIEMTMPWLLKKAFLLVFNKEKMMAKPMSPGFKIPKKGESQFQPSDDTSTEEGLAALREAVERYKSEPTRADHILFGKLTDHEWNEFNLRHAEMHMSFAVPK